MKKEAAKTRHDYVAIDDDTLFDILGDLVDGRKAAKADNRDEFKKLAQNLLDTMNKLPKHSEFGELLPKAQEELPQAIKAADDKSQNLLNVFTKMYKIFIVDEEKPKRK